MPIDFAAVAARFRGPLVAETKLLALSLERLDDWLSARTKLAQHLERATQAYPVLRFYQDALTVRIAASQHESLTTSEPVPSIGDSLSAGSKPLSVAVEQELALPRLLGVAGAMLEAIVASMERWAVPAAGWLDLRAKRSASDLIGQVLWFLPTLGANKDQIVDFASGVRGVLHALNTDSDASSARKPDLPSTLGSIVQWIVGSILLLPLIAPLIDATLRSTVLGARLTILDRLQEVETSVHDVRRSITDVFYVTLANYGRDAFALVTALQEIVVSNFEFYVRFLDLYVSDLYLELQTFARDLTDFFRAYQAFAELLPTLIEQVLDSIDIMPAWLKALLPVGAVPLRLTLLDLMNMVLGLQNGWYLRNELEGLLYEAEGVLYVARPVLPLGAPHPLEDKVKALRQLLHLVLTPRPFPPETKLPPRYAPGFPDVSLLVAGVSGAQVRLVGEALQAELQRAFNAGAFALHRTAELARTAAAGVGQLSSVAAYQQVADRATAAANLLFGNQLKDVSIDRVAHAFETSMSRGGFVIIGEVLPGYVGAMRSYWLQNWDRVSEASEPMTSPHILARHARLGRVRLNTMTLRIAADTLDDDLARQVARRFRAAVQDAYQTGVVRHAALAAA